MKKGNLKQFFEANWGWFAFAIWLLLIAGTTGYLSEGRSIVTKITLIAFCVIYAVAGLAMIVKAYAKWEKQEAETKEKRLRELEKRYKYYIDLVNVQVQETLNKLELLSAFELNTSLEYLISFEHYKNQICRNIIVGEPDSFIIASCLIYSLIDHPIITAKVPEKLTEKEKTILEKIKFSINLDIAMNCAFQIISEPTTYYKDNSCWIEERHQKVNIVVPNGLIKNNDLYQRIIGTIYRDELENKRTSIMQFSNLLHLIYLNCQ